MKLQYGIYAIIVFFSLTLATNSAHADTLDPETVKSLVNGFNPIVGPIPTKSYLPPSGCPIPSADNSQGSINKIQCGLYASDPLNNETKTRSELEAQKGYWTYGGSAAGFNPPAPLDFFKDVDGLHIGVQAPTEGTYAGYYAVSPNTNGMLFHSQITSPLRTTPSGYYQNGIYVQTAQDPINYIACVSITNNAATLWAVVHTYSSPFQALVFDTLYVDTSANQPLTRDCTIITNGSNYLEVYLDNSLVYSSDALALAMPAPFNFFLEPQSSYSGQMLYGVYRDYYATTDKNIRIENVPQNATSVTLVDGSGNVLSSVPPVLGTARLDVAKYHYPLDASIKAYDSSGMLLASTPASQTIYGGDLYSTVYPSSTDETRQKIDSTISDASKLVISAINDATQRLNDAIASATSTAISTINSANQTANSQVDAAKQQAISAIITANQTAISTIDTAKQNALSAISDTNQTATQTGDSAKQQAITAISFANQTLAATMDNATRTAFSTIDSATQTALSTINSTNQTATATLDATKQTVTTTTDTAKQQVSAAIITANQTAISTIDSATQTALSTIDTATQAAITTINTANQTATATVGTAGGQLAHLSVTSADVSGTEFDGMWTELWRNGVLIQQGYTPFSTYVQTGAPYEVFMGNWNNITFDHWEDGSTNQMRPFTSTQDTAFTAFFRTT